MGKGTPGGKGKSNQSPVASFYAVEGPTGGWAFTDTSRDPDGSIVSRVWRDSWGGTGTGLTYQVSPRADSEPMNVTVTLAVTDNKGATGEVMGTFLVQRKGGVPTGGEPPPSEEFYEEAELPRVYVGVDHTLPSTTYKVAPSGQQMGDGSSPTHTNLQTAINDAAASSVIRVKNGTVWTATHTLTAKAGKVFIRPENEAAAMPSGPNDRLKTTARGGTINPANQPILLGPQISSTLAGPALQTATAAQNWHIAGLGFGSAVWSGSGRFTNAIVDLQHMGGASKGNLANYARDIVLDRCRIWNNDNDSQFDCGRAIYLDSIRTAIINCEIMGIAHKSQDSQGILGINGGPYLIDNCYVEAAGENIMFGGAPASAAATVPQDIFLRKSWLNKPDKWNQHHPSYGGIDFVVKNIWELKCAKRVLVEDCWLENNWIDGQNAGIIYQPTHQMANPGVDWCDVEDVVMRYCAMVRSAWSFNFLARFDYPGQPMSRIVFAHMLLDQMAGDEPYRGTTSSRGIGLNGGSYVDGTRKMKFIHMTFGPHTHSYAFLTSGSPDGTFKHEHLTIRDSMFLFGTGSSGISGNGAGTNANTALSLHAESNHQVQGNIFTAMNGAQYPSGNYFPATNADIQVTNLSGRNYKLATSSPYRNVATDGTDPGADWDTLQSRLAGVKD